MPAVTSAEPLPTMRNDELVLGIDGGGTKTVAWLAVRSCQAESSVVGRGTAGPANPQTVGFAKAIENLDRAIAAAVNEARAGPGPVAAAVLALAGSDRQQNRRRLHGWAEDRRLARRFRLVHDALPVLLAGSPDGWGVALISGTGSLAFGQTPDGRSARAGGWGFLFGDEGSGYALAVAGLRAAARSADGRGPATELLGALLDRLGLRQPEELILAVHRMADDRAAIASLAEVVTQAAAQGDTVAQEILHEAAGELAAMVAAVARKLEFSSGPFPLALAGGAMLGSHELRRSLCVHLDALGLNADPMADVADPVVGAVRCAQSEADK